MYRFGIICFSTVHSFGLRSPPRPSRSTSINRTFYDFASFQCSAIVAIQFVLATHLCVNCHQHPPLPYHLQPRSPTLQSCYLCAMKWKWKNFHLCITITSTVYWMCANIYELDTMTTVVCQPSSTTSSKRQSEKQKSNPILIIMFNKYSPFNDW